MTTTHEYTHLCTLRERAHQQWIQAIHDVEERLAPDSFITECREAWRDLDDRCALAQLDLVKPNASIAALAAALPPLADVLNAVRQLERYP